MVNRMIHTIKYLKHSLGKWPGNKSLLFLQWSKGELSDNFGISFLSYEGESISNQPNLFPVEIHLFFFDVIAL